MEMAAIVFSRRPRMILHHVGLKYHYAYVSLAIYAIDCVTDVKGRVARGAV